MTAKLFLPDLYIITIPSKSNKWWVIRVKLWLWQFIAFFQEHISINQTQVMTNKSTSMAFENEMPKTVHLDSVW